MTQVKAAKTETPAGGRKLALRKETLRDLKVRNPETQQVKGGRNCSGTESGCSGN